MLKAAMFLTIAYIHFMWTLVDSWLSVNHTTSLIIIILQIYLLHVTILQSLLDALTYLSIEKLIFQNNSELINWSLTSHNFFQFQVYNIITHFSCLVTITGCVYAQSSISEKKSLQTGFLFFFCHACPCICIVSLT